MYLHGFSSKDEIIKGNMVSLVKLELASSGLENSSQSNALFYSLRSRFINEVVP